ncbi:FAD-dependent oxidoreductase [Azohydromonas lata]|uniref:FAD-dependent oxidoreductase n=1 Tax=Azohydromonas lata TaxID=45677 RepID=UPI000832C6E7|nr:FAD-dependent oxidoreductase [Azohydromonas lata]
MPSPTAASPLPPLVVFCHLRWGFVYQRPQHLLSRLSEHYRVLFVEEPVHCEGEPRLDRVPQGSNLEVLVPRTPVTAPGFHDDQLSVLKPLLAEFMRQEGIEDSLVWFYTPMALPLVAALKPRAVVYDCMDELSAFKNAPKQLRQRENALMKMSSVVFTGGPALFEAKRPLHPNVHCLPSSVDVHHFAPQRLRANSAEAQEAQRLQAHIPPGPRLGFYGVIDERLDLALVAAVADAHPEWQLVMVGPVVKIDPASLPQRPNITYLGMQSYALLPHLMAPWDLCLMPFALNESTRFISPTKTLEYMAGEKPVVSTAVRDVEVPYGGIVRIGRDPVDFIQGCEEMLALGEAERRLLVGRMQEALRKVSWDRSARTVARLLRQALRASTADSPAALRELAGLAPAEGFSSTSAATPVVRTAGASQPPAVRHMVIGAGATGLSAAYHLGLHDEGHDTLVVEREEHVGGGCRSVHQQGYTFDHGAHVLQSGDPEVKALAERLLGDNLHWLPPRVRHVEQPAPQVGLPPLRADRDFGYPLHGGFQALMDAFLPKLDCELALKTTLLHLSPSRRTVRLDDGRSLRFDTLISTIPLPALVQACGEEAPAELRNAARTLRQGSLRCVNLGIGLAPGREKLTDAHWMEVPAGTVFQRVFVQGNASAHNNAPGGFALSCEIAYGPDQPLPCEGAALIDRVIADCRRIGLFSSADPVHFASQLDLPCARALPDAAQQAALLLIRQWFGEHGIVLAGHHGRWQAEGAPHAFTAGRQAAELVMTLLRQRGALTTTALQQAG